MWELTGSYMIMPRFGKATLKVEERRPTCYDSPGTWIYRWRWAKVEDVKAVHLNYSN